MDAETVRVGFPRGMTTEFGRMLPVPVVGVVTVSVQLHAASTETQENQSNRERKTDTDFPITYSTLRLFIYFGYSLEFFFSLSRFLSRITFIDIFLSIFFFGIYLLRFICSTFFFVLLDKGFFLFGNSFLLIR